MDPEASEICPVGEFELVNRSKPGTPIVWQKPNNRIGIAWAVSDTSDDVKSYIIQWKKAGEKVWKQLVEAINVKPNKDQTIQTDMTLDLEENESYTFTVQASYTDDDLSYPSELCEFKQTPIDQSYAEPDDLCKHANEALHLEKSLPANYETGDMIRPGKPIVSQLSPIRAEIAWNEPDKCDERIVEAYIIKYKSPSDNTWKTMRIPGTTDQQTAHQFKTDIPVEPNVSIIFSVQAWYKDNCVSEDSDVSDEFKIVALPEEICKAKVKESSTEEKGGKPSILQMKMKLACENANQFIKKFEYGIKNEAKACDEKVIMIVGATGAGKSTLINGMINYIFGILWEDPIRLKLIPENLSSNQAISQTKSITSYTIHHEPGLKVPYSLTIIDTPGFGDTGGYKRDEEITDHIREFFTGNRLDSIDHIDAVGFVTQSSLPRLTPTQRYIFDKILSLFGKDIEDNITMLLTFADAQKPPVLSGIKEAGFKYNKYFKFNNSAIYADIGYHIEEENGANSADDTEEEDNAAFNKMFWEMGMKSFKLCFDALSRFERKSLSQTKEVLVERHQLELDVMQMHTEISLGLNKLETLTEEVKIVINFEAQINANKDFEYTVFEDTIVKQDIPHSQYTTNCINCNRTCHERCAIKDDSGKMGCWAMTGGNCRICPNKCHWTAHKNMPFVMTTVRREVTKQAKDLLERYEQGVDGKTTKERLIDNLKKDFDNHQTTVWMLTEKVRQTIEYLNEIALKPNPMSTLDYIDTLIDSESAEQRPGYHERVKQLKQLRVKTEMFINMVKKGEDPFEKFRENFEAQLEKEENKGEQLEDSITTKMKSFVTDTWTAVKDGLSRTYKGKVKYRKYQEIPSTPI
ncbi:unnamed protein product [Owenia fusiformis]|uniref:Fibronectin type-III domain-containing protein n=1 Tax=Owenia fusiformis TaxID=6347 RepID=A0A8S4NL41_OWEFU|nr:unnamed protein product [Owenia fusiformis]